MASSRASCDIITPLLRDIQDSTAFLEGHESPSSEDSLSLAVVEADRFSLSERRASTESLRSTALTPELRSRSASPISLKAGTTSQIEDEQQSLRTTNSERAESEAYSIYQNSNDGDEGIDTPKSEAGVGVERHTLKAPDVEPRTQKLMSSGEQDKEPLLSKLTSAVPLTSEAYIQHKALQARPSHSHTRLTISDDQSEVEKREERNLLALRDRKNVKDHPFKTVSLVPGLQAVPSNIHALPDCHLQMLLETKRYLKAQHDDYLRQEQKETNMEPMDNFKSAGSSSINPNTLSTKRPAPDPGASELIHEVIDDMDVVELEEYIGRLQARAKLLGTRGSKCPASRYQTLYRVLHQPITKQRKPIPALSPPFFDPPECIVGQHKTRILRCSVPVDNFDLYLEQNKDISFLVYKTYVEPDKHTTIQSAASKNSDSPILIKESIRPIAPHLITAIEAVLKSRDEYADMLQFFKTSHEIQSPYLFMYHHRNALDGIRNGLDTLAREQLSMFSNYVAQNLGSDYSLADSLITQGQIVPEYVNCLFRPGDVVVRHHNGEFEGWVARTWPQQVKQERVPRALAEAKKKSARLPLYYSKEASERTGNDVVLLQTWSIEAWQWEFDGSFQRRFDYLQFVIQSEESSGFLVENFPASGHSSFQDVYKALQKRSVVVKDLMVFPLRHADSEVVDKLRKRGRMFWKCRERRFVSYQENESDNAQSSTEERYVIDMKTYRSLHKGSQPYNSMKDELGPDIMVKDELPDEQFELLLPRNIKGYNLRRKKWYDLVVDRISDVTWNMEAFSKVVMDRKAKDLIRALVEKQLASEVSTDLIIGKGNGLILLLHGSPGTGKTLTAESVAEICEKPLYRVTCGDVGTKAEDVEKYLESVFHLGKLWDCVVLLDEADVFLEQRSLEDLERNALVSVFLRMLEYYEGILVLTSNRVGTFDEAFKSRIQLALHYPALGPYQRLRIWENFIDRLDSFKDDSIDIADLRDNLDALKDEKMNGRQIRNAITTARQYAQWKGRTLTYEHLRDVIDVAGRFDKYLNKLHGGHDDDVLAEEDGLRLAS